MSAYGATSRKPHRALCWQDPLGVLVYSLSVFIVAAVIFPATVLGSRPLFMGGGSGGVGPIPPYQNNGPGILNVTPIDPANRYILAQLIVEDPHRRVVLRSPDGDRLVLPTQRTADGLFIFIVGKDTHWLLTVTNSDVVDLPISAGQDVTIALP